MDGDPHPMTPRQTMHVAHSHRTHQIHGCLISSGEEMQEEEELDPRIQIELEKLNKATEEINRLELELDDARAAFRQVLSDSTQRLNGLAKKLGTCVDKARPYYDSRVKLKEAHLDSQKAALRFERACSMHEAAKEMVQLAEEGYKRRELDVDPTWQEMLNHATMKVNDAERERMESEDHHQCTTLAFKKRDEEVQKLQKDLKRVIAKSKPYFEMKAKFNQVMEDHKRIVSRLEEDVCSTKALYSEALRSLEAISDDIHRQRLERRQKMQLGVREAGVGAESPSPPPSWVKGGEGSVASSGFQPDGDIFSMSSLGRSLQSDKLSFKSGASGQEYPFCLQSAIQDDNNSDGTLDSDPLNVVIFKNPSRESKLSSQLAASLKHSPCITNKDSPGATQDDIETSNGTGENSSFQIRSNIVNEEEVTAKESKTDPSSFSPLSLDNNFSPQDISIYQQSSLSRAQEWVNKSPVPQQRRFVKSKSLIDASSSLVVSKPPSSLSPLSSSLTSDAMKSLQASKLQNQELSESQECVEPRGLTTSISPAARQPISVKTTVSISSPRSLSSTPEQLFSPLSTSPSALRDSPPIRKSPKLQGLILRVDAEAMSQASTSSPPVSQTPVVKATMSGVTKETSPVIFTNLPDLQVLSPRQHQHQQQTAMAASSQSPQQTAVSVNASRSLLSAAVSVAHSSPAQSSSSSLYSTTITTTASSTTSPVSLAKSLVSKVSSYSSKTAPSTLGGSYHLPSPTHARLTLGPPVTHRQAVSPTPLSPSGDRFSILSSRSDSLSASNRGSLLKVPSDSSDTESIASTGPMLDDDQVEYLTMDFNEQSITSNRNEEEEMSEYLEDGPLSSIQRGHWSRMSLPPRLSYLEGYLDRARHNMAARDGKEDDEADHQVARDDGLVNDDTLSMEGSVDHERNSQEDQDTLDFSPLEDKKYCDNTLVDSMEITFTIDSVADKDNRDDGDEDDADKANEEDGISGKEKAIAEECDDCGENVVHVNDLSISCEDENDINESNHLKMEATIVLLPEGGISEIDNNDSYS